MKSTKKFSEPLEIYYACSTVVCRISQAHTTGLWPETEWAFLLYKILTSSIIFSSLELLVVMASALHFKTTSDPQSMRPEY